VPQGRGGEKKSVFRGGGERHLVQRGGRQVSERLHNRGRERSVPALRVQAIVGEEEGKARKEERDARVPVTLFFKTYLSGEPSERGE